MMKINVGIFFGGSSVEHEISVLSALQAIHAMQQEQYQVIPVYIHKQGMFYTGEALLQVENYKDLPGLLRRCQSVTFVRQDNEVVMYRTPPGLFGNKLGKIDIAFPIVHGTNCEDGTIQGLFELLRIPYVGCDITSSALGMDKAVMKDILSKHGIPIVPHLSCYMRDWYNEGQEILKKVQKELGYPVIVKPANLGSSVGIKKAVNAIELEEAITLAGSFASKIIIERAITSLKEVNCAVLGDTEKAEASVCEEPLSSEEILSYQDKYMNKSGAKGMQVAKRKVPAEITAEQEALIRKLALDTFQTLGCNGVSRIDFLMDRADHEKIYVNEINTIPGSLSFYLWEATGKSFSTLLTEMINLGFKRERERKNLVFTYDANIFAMGGVGVKGAKGTKA